MTCTIGEALEFVKVNDVKFIRFAFSDLFGTHKNMSVLSNQFSRAYNEGIAFDAAAIQGFGDTSGANDLFLFPDLSTLSVLPWRPQQGRVVRFFCDIKNAEGEPFVCDTRSIMKKAVKRCESLGYSCKIGPECEFYLFKTDENGEPTQVPYDNGGYFDIAPLDKGENVRREICLCLEEMGILPELSLHEQGPGQNEIDFKHSSALSAADNFLTLKSVVKAIASRDGLYASFMPRPIAGKSGNGLHINIFLSKDGANLFKSVDKPGAAASFIAGVLERSAEMSAFLNPTVNSYDRLGTFEAPKYISWSPQNRSQLVRIPAESGDRARMELRSPDPAVNPYIAFALIIHAGLDGIEKGLELAPPLNVDLHTAGDDVLSELSFLPQSLDKALKLAKNSTFIKNILGDTLLSRYVGIKEAEVSEFTGAHNKEGFLTERYFKLL